MIVRGAGKKVKGAVFYKGYRDLSTDLGVELATTVRRPGGHRGACGQAAAQPFFV
jgi:hypothetical protein